MPFLITEIFCLVTQQHSTARMGGHVTHRMTAVQMALFY